MADYNLALTVTGGDPGAARYWTARAYWIEEPTRHDDHGWLKADRRRAEDAGADVRDENFAGLPGHGTRTCSAGVLCD